MLRAHGGHRHPAHQVHVLAGPHLAVSLPLCGHELLPSSIAAGTLKRGHESPLLLGDVRGIIIVIEVGEVILIIVVDLVEHLGVARPPWGPFTWRTSMCAARATAPVDHPMVAEAFASSRSLMQSSPWSWAAP
jgi:hypothetical protein